mmetsp:Transcript_8235/g.14544  ORF Transcript_8235/g.14544 Transcript_8235/m.14544 type:complete len:149 (-) Transcript_8235:158-604(-)
MSSSGGNDASPDVTVQLDYYTSLQFVALAVNDIYKSKRVGEDSLCDREFGIELVASQSNLQERGSRLAIHHIHTRGCTWFAPAASSLNMLTFPFLLSNVDLQLSYHERCTRRILLIGQIIIVDALLAVTSLITLRTQLIRSNPLHYQN